MESVKLAGACLIVGSSFWVGLWAARGLKRAERQIRDLDAALTLMENELRFTSTRFGPLCSLLAQRSRGAVSGFFSAVAADLEAPDFRSVGAARRAAEKAGLVLPPGVFFAVEGLIDGFGRYDLEGQLRQLAAARAELSRQAEQLRLQMDNRCRTYELLGLCTGLAVLILVL